MWKPEHRATADRRGLRYESDLTEAEWALVAPLIRPAKRGGRPRTVNVREVLNAIFYVLWTGCQWKALPKDLPPRYATAAPPATNLVSLRRSAQAIRMSLLASATTTVLP